MAANLDCFSSLLCTEDNTAIFSNDDSDFFMEEDTWQHSNISNVLPLPLQSEEFFTLTIKKESQQLHNVVDYLNKIQSGDFHFEGRKEAIGWIEKAVAHFGFSPLCSYLSINYLDRFLAAYELQDGQIWTMQLLAITCLSLAAKIEETDVPRTFDLQVPKSRFIFEAKSIKRMELLVLSTLKWRMQSITPFSFIDYFISKIIDDQSLLTTSTSRSTQLILSTVKGIEFLEFKSSEIAAAVAMCVVGERNGKTIDIGEVISIMIQYVERERLLKCYELIQKLSLDNNGSTWDSSVSFVPCVSQSPMSVLDDLCLGYIKDDTIIGGSCCLVNSPNAKRRKLLK